MKVRCDVGGNRGTTSCWQLMQFGLKGGKHTTFVVGYTQKLIRGFQPLMGFWYTMIWRNEALLG